MSDDQYAILTTMDGEVHLVRSGQDEHGHWSSECYLDGMSVYEPGNLDESKCHRHLSLAQALSVILARTGGAS